MLCLQKAATENLSKKDLLEIILNGAFVEETVDESAEICYNITKHDYFSTDRTRHILRQCRPTGKCHKWRNSKMDVMGTCLSYIADIGVAAAKKQFNIKLDEKKARAALSNYMERQRKYNLNCSKDEEIDFEGLSKYICDELLDDVTIRLFGEKSEREAARQTIFTNEEQENFSFNVMLAMNIASNTLNLTIAPMNPSNAASLRYRRFIKKAMAARNIALKSLQQNEVIVSSKINLTLQNCEQIDDEIEFLQKIVTIEDYFHIELDIPKVITEGDNLVIGRLYSMITFGEFAGVTNKLKMSFDLSQKIRNAIYDFERKPEELAWITEEEVNLFDQKISVPIIRRFDHLCIEDIDRIKAKLQVLDNEDTIRITFINSDGSTEIHYTDVFYSEEAERKFFGNVIDAKGDIENAAGE